LFVGHAVRLFTYAQQAAKAVHVLGTSKQRRVQPIGGAEVSPEGVIARHKQLKKNSVD
jgi:hypothetical protein